jgi:hypothetical protein
MAPGFEIAVLPQASWLQVAVNPTMNNRLAFERIQMLMSERFLSPDV